MDAATGVSSDGDSVVRFPLSTLVIQKGDITKWSIDGYADAIVCKTLLSFSTSRMVFETMNYMFLARFPLLQVNPANERMLGGGGAGTDGGN